ncbi:putative uncharacterized protein [Anaerotruncus sp. CAG:390]|nr:putative uncharacterized protein [Anaerotruncus sp. CAG:390]
MKKIKASGLDRLFAAISETKELYLPVRGEKDVSYKLWSEGTEYAADALNTVKSPKDLFFPQSENLYAMKTTEGGRKIDLVDNSYGGRDFVVFGVRACDAASFGILDRVFLSNPVDAYYKARREKGVVVTVACREPETSCFCHTFGIDPAEPAGDVSCIFAGDSLYLDAKTEKGAALLDSLGVLEDAADADLDVVEAEKTVARDNLAKTPLYDLTTEGFGAGKTMELFGSPKWAELSEACLGCGTCTFVCPTCQCYDIRDYDTGHGVQRYRCWDSCMFSEFTRMSAGQPRLTQVERFRQRFMHKLVYYPENNEGVFSCVGCGRCVVKCPQHLNIVKVIKTLGKEHK